MSLQLAFIFYKLNAMIFNNLSFLFFVFEKIMHVEKVLCKKKLLNKSLDRKTACCYFTLGIKTH